MGDLVIRPILEKLKQFHYQRSIQDLQAVIETLEDGRFPRFWSFWHGGPFNGWPRVSVQDHIEALREIKERREAWIQEAKGGT